MKVAKSRVWKTAEGKLVEDGHDDAAFLFAAKGMMVPDSIVEQFDNGGDFFEDSKTTQQEVFNHPIVPSFTAGQTNVGVVKDEEPAPSNIPVPGDPVEPGYTNVGKKGKKSKED